MTAREPTPDRRQRKWRAGICLLFCALALGGVSFSSCSTLPGAVLNPPAIEGAHYVGNLSCADCHTNITRVFAMSPHARFFKEKPSATEISGCESCHGPGSKHVEAGGGRGKFIVNPGRDPSSCFQCHLDVHAEFNLPHHHPLPEARLNCVACHDPHGMDIFKPATGLAMARLNQNCATCHREQSKPVVFEHEAMREGCTVCHQPHGSVNRMLLVERDANLCLKCHAQIQGRDVAPGELFIGKVPHSAFLTQGTCWSAGCHTAIHGSNMSALMLY